MSSTTTNSQMISSVDYTLDTVARAIDEQEKEEKKQSTSASAPAPRHYNPHCPRHQNGLRKSSGTTGNTGIVRKSGGNGIPKPNLSRILHADHSDATKESSSSTLQTVNRLYLLGELGRSSSVAIPTPRLPYKPPTPIMPSAPPRFSPPPVPAPKCTALPDSSSSSSSASKPVAPLIIAATGTQQSASAVSPSPTPTRSLIAASSTQQAASVVVAQQSASAVSPAPTPTRSPIAATDSHQATSLIVVQQAPVPENKVTPQEMMMAWCQFLQSVIDVSGVFYLANGFFSRSFFTLIVQH